MTTIGHVFVRFDSGGKAELLDFDEREAMEWIPEVASRCEKGSRVHVVSRSQVNVERQGGFGGWYVTSRVFHLPVSDVFDFTLKDGEFPKLAQVPEAAVQQGYEVTPDGLRITKYTEMSLVPGYVWGVTEVAGSNYYRFQRPIVPSLSLNGTETRVEAGEDNSAATSVPDAPPVPEPSGEKVVVQRKTREVSKQMIRPAWPDNLVTEATARLKQPGFGLRPIRM